MKIGVVIVTRNRLDCLKIALDRYKNQTKQPEYVLVVDNCSTDGQTPAFLDIWEQEPAFFKKYVVHSKENTGGSGGFYLAESEALKLDADWIWHADDDAYPDLTVLEEIEKAYNACSYREEVAAFCSSVKNVNNPEEDISSWKKLFKGLIFIKWLPANCSVDFFEVDKFMYLGVVIRKTAIQKVGATRKDLFIHEDDIEHSLRIGKTGKIIAVKNAKLYHPKWEDTIDKNKLNWKYYYTVRNKILSIKFTMPLQYYFGQMVKASVRHTYHKLQKYPQNVLAMEKDAILDAKNSITGRNERYLP